MSEYDGSWRNDPLDLRCIRLDAENDAIGNHTQEEIWQEREKWFPKTLQDLFRIKMEDPNQWELYMFIVSGTTHTRSRDSKPYNPCCVLDNDNNIKVRWTHDPYCAREETLELSIKNNNLMKDYKILCLRNLKVIPLEEVSKYE